MSLSTSPTISGIAIETSDPCVISFGTYQNSDAGNYTVTIFANDSKLDTDQTVSFQFDLEIVDNESPQNTSTIADRAMVAHAIYPNNTFNFPADVFSDTENDSLTYTIASVPSSSIFVLDSSATTLTVANTNNSHVGNYTLTISANDSYSVGSTSFNIEITENQGPHANSTTSLPNLTIHGNRTTEISLGNDLFIDSEGDTISLSMDVSPSLSIMSLNSSNYIIVNDTLNTYEGNYTINITAKDQYSDTTQSSRSFVVELLNNYSPTTPEIIANVSVLVHYAVNIDWVNNQFVDANNDTITSVIEYDTTGSWFTAGDVSAKFVGTPDSNTQAGNYTITLKLTDDYGGETKYDVGLEIKPNTAPVYNTSANSTLDVQCLHYVEVDLTQYFSEADGESLGYTIETPANASWIEFDNTTHKMHGTPQQ